VSWESGTILAGGIATLAIFSFLVKENVFFRFFEHLFIGIAAGLAPIVTIKNFLWPQILEPMLGLNITTFPDGTTSKEYNELTLLYLFPMVFGLLYYFIYSKKHGWLAKIVIGLSLGASAGLAFKGFFNEMLPQIFGSFKPLVVFDDSNQFDVLQSLNNILFIVILLSVMNYFFFSFGKREGEVAKRITASGRWFLMVCFGAFFGSTVMARMALLVERLQFLYSDWFGVIRSWI